MAGLFPNRLSSDSLDQYSHKWMVLLLLVLSLTSFIIPLHPSYQDQSEKLMYTIPRQTVKPLRVEVFCWTPAQFTRAQIVYAYAFCGNLFNAALRGDKNVTSVYVVIEGNDPGDTIAVPLPESRKIQFEKKREEKRRLNKEEEIEKRQDQREIQREQLKVRFQKLVTFQVPIMLLVVAICLLIPQAIWSFLSQCCSPFNVDETLESAKQAHTMDASSRKQICQELSVSITSSVRSSTKTASVLYLVKKIMTILMLLAVILVVTQHALLEVEKLDNDFDRIPSTTLDTGLPRKVNATSQRHTDFANEPINTVFFCDFEILQLGMKDKYAMQCTTVEDKDNDGPKSMPLKSQSNKSTTNERNLLEFEYIMLTIVTALLAILTVDNVIILCLWVIKLMTTSSKMSIGLTSDTAMDIVFLVQMARLNTGADVAYSLAQMSTGCENVDFSEITEKQ